jgi:uncharacterized protein with FMN-binding domain
MAVATDNKNGLIALGSVAVLGVYSAGWFKTKAAAERFADEAVERRPPAPSAEERPQVRAVERTTPSPSVSSQPRLRAGAVASVPPMPKLTRAANRDSASPAKPEPAAPASTITTSTPAAAAAPVTSSAPASPTVETPRAATAASLGFTTMTAPEPAAPPTVPAPAPEHAVPAAAKPAEPVPRRLEVVAAKWKDGTYYGWGTSRHGDIQAAVTIQAGRITSALISQCLTRYSCSWIAALPSQVVNRQSAEVDYVSGATQSTNAFYYAVLEALNQAK